MSGQSFLTCPILAPDAITPPARAQSTDPLEMLRRIGELSKACEEVAKVLLHVIARIRRHRPHVDILVRGDSHYCSEPALALAGAHALQLHHRLRHQLENCWRSRRPGAPDATCGDRECHACLSRNPTPHSVADPRPPRHPVKGAPEARRRSRKPLTGRLKRRPRSGYRMSLFRALRLKRAARTPNSARERGRRRRNARAHEVSLSRRPDTIIRQADAQASVPVARFTAPPLLVGAGVSFCLRHMCGVKGNSDAGVASPYVSIRVTRRRAPRRPHRSGARPHTPRGGAGSC